MTVCIAAICSADPGKLMVVGASDRMLSAPDLKYEPPQTKNYNFFPWVSALVAGDPYAQITVCQRTSAFFSSDPRNVPQTVEGVAKAYAEVFTAYRREMAETRHLKPLGLDANSLLERQGDFPRDFVGEMRHELKNSPLEVETIITGMDATGPHIFVVSDPGLAECHDLMSFAAIGIGKHHASSQFMMGRFSRFEDWRKALMQTFMAKKRAEVSPTVGPATDLFFFNRNQSGQVYYGAIGIEIHAELERIYTQVEERIDWVTQQAFHDFGAFVEKGMRQQAEASQPLPEATEKIAAPPPEEDPISEAEKSAKRTPKKRRGRTKAAMADEP